MSKLNEKSMYRLNNIDKCIEKCPEGLEVEVMCGIIIRQILELRQELDELKESVDE